jgi:gluconokinase
MSDTLGKPVTLSGVKEASSRGAALLALQALGGSKIEATKAPPGKTFNPNPDRHNTYRQALERQHRLYEDVLGPPSTSS